MTIRTQAHHPSTGAVIPSAGLEANFVELYDLQNGGIDGTNMDLSAVFAWTGIHSFDGNLLYLDATNNRIYEGTTASTTIDSIDFQHQITALSAGTAAFALISTATGATGVKEARYHFSASPADGDRIWDLGIYGKNDVAADVKYATILAIADDVTSGTEDSHLSFQVCSAGTLASMLLVYGDQININPESLTVGTNTNVVPYGTGEILGLYVKNTSADRKVAFFESTDQTAGGIIFDLYKNSASPAASDVLSQIRFVGNDSGANATVYSEIISRIVSPTNGSENGQLDLRVVSNGTATAFLEAVSTAGAVEVTLTGQLTVVGVTNSITSTNSTGDAFTITASSLTTGSALVITSNSSSSSTRNLVEIINDNTSATAANCLNIKQDSNAGCVYLDNNGDFSAITIDSSGDANEEIYIGRAANTASDVYGLNIQGSNAGAGDYVGISFGSGLNALFKTFDASAGALGAFSGSFLIVDSGGTQRKVPYYVL